MVGTAAGVYATLRGAIVENRQAITDLAHHVDELATHITSGSVVRSSIMQRLDSVLRTLKSSYASNRHKFIELGLVGFIGGLRAIGPRIPPTPAVVQRLKAIWIASGFFNLVNGSIVSAAPLAQLPMSVKLRHRLMFKKSIKN